MTNTQERDLGLLLRVTNADTQAFETLYDAHASLMYAVALRILNDTGDAEEVLQDAWVQAWREASRYDSRRGTVAAWLVTLARTRAIDRYRSIASRHKGHEKLSRHVPPPAPQTPAAALMQSQLQQHLSKALNALHSQQRRVLDLAYFQGLSQSQIATELGAPLGTVKSWTRQGLRTLRDLIPGEHS